MFSCKFYVTVLLKTVIYVPNLKYLAPPVTKIGKATQNAENRVVWDS